MGRPNPSAAADDARKKFRRLTVMRPSPALAAGARPCQISDWTCHLQACRRTAILKADQQLSSNTGDQAGMSYPTLLSALWQRELAPVHCPMSPVLPTERIAHLGTAADCRIHPPGGTR